LAGVIKPTILPASLLIPGVLTTSYAPPKALDLATISLPVTAVGGDVSMSVINRIADDQSSLILSGTYSRPVIGNASFFVSGFRDLDTQDTGLFAGLTVPLGNNGNAQVGVTSSGGQTGVSAEYDKTATHEPGSVGWRIGDSEGNIAARSAAVTYQGSAARFEGGVDQLNNQISGWATVDGAVVATSSGVFLSNRVDDAFAVVDVGAPNVDVSLENLKVATTDANGRALIPGLRSYQRNKISIDPTTLPSDAVTPDVATQAVPGDRNGIAVTFKSSSVSDAAVVVFRDHTGAYVPVGAVGTLTSTGQQFVVGYDGRAFIEGLGLQNTAKIDAGDQGCTASFSFKPSPGTQVVIEDVMCK